MNNTVVVLLSSAAQSSPGSLPQWVPWAALVAGIVSIGLHAAARCQENRDRRRTFYSEAYMEPLRWVELVYRVRRRTEGQTGELIDRFHAVQERTGFYRSWLATESPALARSYDRFVKTIGDATRPLLQQGWREEPIPPESGVQDIAMPSAVERAKESFLDDVAAHLSWNPGARLRFRRRNTPTTSSRSDSNG